MPAREIVWSMVIVSRSLVWSSKSDREKQEHQETFQ